MKESRLRKGSKKAPLDLSIIIPLRNTKAYHRETKRLETCLASIAAQTIRDRIEVIVSDMGSDPYYRTKHAAICKAGKARHVYVADSGPWSISRARNIGVRAARGTYVMTLDVDCVLMPGFCEKLLGTIDKDKIVHCQVWELPEGYKGSLSDYEKMQAVSTLRPKHGLGSCQAVSRAWAEYVHGWDEQFVTWGAEDTDFRERAVLSGKSEAWLDAAYFHQYHNQGNRQENSEQLAANRRRLELTKARQLPLIRNIYAWGGELTDEKTDTAILITTFLRDSALFRCVKLCKKYYPTLPIFVADCGRPTPEKTQFLRDYEVMLVQADFDAGVSATRNLGVKHIPKQYKYVVILEDDIELGPDSDFTKWRKVLDADHSIGVVGGMLHCIGLGVSTPPTEQHYEAKLEIKDRTIYIRAIEKPDWKTANGVRYHLADLILNVFMVRHEVVDAAQWDDRIKAAPEHCNWFMALKQNGTCRVAYTPEVVLGHAKYPMSDAAESYDTFRRRNGGFQYMAENFDVDYLWSTWHAKHGFPNPLNLRERADDKSATMLKNLRAVVDILNRHKCRWWLEAGTCLGAIREGGFIGHDPDIDIGLAESDLPKWDAIRDDCIKAGFEIYKEWEHEGRRTELSMKRAGIKLDLFFYFERGEHMWHGAFGVDPKKRHEFLPHVFSRELFTDLKDIPFQGLRCFVPNPPEQYLTARYGPDWKTPNKGYVYWRDCKAIDRNFFKPKPEVFIGGVWDLLHVGHVRMLARCKALARGGVLTVGVLTDDAAARYKPRPIIPEKEREAMVLGLKCVDYMIPQHDTDPTADFEKLGYTPDYIVHGDDWATVPGDAYVRMHGGKSVILPYTPGVSSTDIKRRIIERGIEEAPKVKSEKPSDKIAVGIKTFMRAPTLYRALNELKKNCPVPYKLYIADDGPLGDEKKYRYQKLRDEGHSVFMIPFNSGISAGRNAIIKAVKEDYILMADDDVVLADLDALPRMRAVLDARPDIGLVAAVIRGENGGYFASEGYAKGIRFEMAGHLLKRTPAPQKIERVGDDGPLYVVADQVPNFFLARRALFDSVRWDDRIRIEYEHMAFFLDLQKTAWKAAVCLDAGAVHLISTPEHEYSVYRRTSSPAYFFQRYGLSGVSNQF